MVPDPHACSLEQYVQQLGTNVLVDSHGLSEDQDLVAIRSSKVGVPRGVMAIEQLVGRGGTVPIGRPKTALKRLVITFKA